MVKRNRNTSPDQMSAHLAKVCGTIVAARTNAQLLNNIGLYAKGPVTCISLQAHNVLKKLHCSKANILWDQQLLSRVMLS